MTDIKALLREAAAEIRASVEAEYGHSLQYPSYTRKYDAGMELPAQLEAAAEAMHTAGTEVDSDHDTVQFTAYLEGLLEAERENVRVLREALEYAVNQVPELGTVPGVKAAYALGEPEVSPYSVAVEIGHLQCVRNNLQEALDDVDVALNWINTMLATAGDNHE